MDDSAAGPLPLLFAAGEPVARAEAAALATEGDETALVATFATEPREAAAEQAAVEVTFELSPHELRKRDLHRAVGDGFVEGRDVVEHHPVEGRRLGAVARVGERASVRHAGRVARLGPGRFLDGLRAPSLSRPLLPLSAATPSVATSPCDARVSASVAFLSVEKVNVLAPQLGVEWSF